MQSQHSPLRLFTRGLRRTKTASSRRAWIAASIAVALGVASCGHAWDDYDPRLDSGTTATAGSGGAAGGSGGAPPGGSTSAGGTHTGGTTSAGGTTSVGGTATGGTATGGTATGGTTTTMTMCAPGSKIGCYSGPDGTQDIGVCKPGQKTCDAQGAGYGPCMGEVIPSFEDCATAADDDCDGNVNEHCALWSKRFGDPGAQYANAVAVDPNGNVIVVGAGEETMSFGGADLNAGGSLSAFVVKLTSSGGHVWSKLWGNDQDQEAAAVATDSSGNVYVTGTFNGAISFNGGADTVQSAGAQDVFIVKLDSTGGALWWKTISGTGTQTASAIALDGSGNVYVAGAFAGNANFAGTMGASNGGLDAYLLKLTNAGASSWLKTFGGPDDDDGATALSNRVASIIVTGYFRQSIDLGEGPFSSAGGSDIFLAKYTSAGTVTFTTAFGAAGDQRPRSVVSNLAAEIFLFGEYSTSVKIGGAPVSSAGGVDLFLAKTGTDGSPFWLKTFGDAADQGAGAMAIDPSGDPRIAAHHRGTIDYGGGPLSAQGAPPAGDVVVGRYSGPMGDYQWSRMFGDAADQDPRGIASDASENTYVVGGLQGTANFGNGALISAGSSDIFIAKIAP